MINCTYNMWDYDLLPKRAEIFEKYTKILQWRRANPTRFIEEFLKIQLTDHQKWMIMSSWVPSTVVWLCSRATRKDLPLYTPIKLQKKGSKKILLKTIGDIEVGDKVYNENGKLISVLQVKPVVFDEIYQIAFEDGSIEECGPYHEWCVREKGEIKNREAIFILNHFSDCIFEIPKFPFKDGLFKRIVGIRNTKKKVPMRCISVDSDTGLFLCGENNNITHNSFMASVFLMTRALLLPNTNNYIMRPSGGQAQETFQKMEDIAKGNIASLMGTSSVFLDECARMNSAADPFTHAKTSYSVSLYNGSTINTLNSVAKNIVGIRSNFSRNMLTSTVMCSKKYPFNCWKLLMLN